MSDGEDPRDHALSRLYREGAWPEPRRQIDRAIIAASRRASRERHPLLWRFAPSFAIAATVVLTSAVVLKVYREQPEIVANSVAEKPAARAYQFAPEPKAAEQKPPETKPAAPPAPEPQAAPTPQGFASTMDAFEAARLERAQRDLGLNDLDPPSAQPKNKTAPAAKPAAANRERRADAPQAPSGPTFSVFGASPPAAQAPVPAPAPTPTPRAAKPAQPFTQAAVPPASDRVAAAPAEERKPTPGPAPAAPENPVDASASLLSRAVGTASLESATVQAAERSPQTWIEDIRKLMKEGKSVEAGEEISKFKKRYPDYVLPEDLR